ncbi:hypothetical protein [Paraburkholderia sp. MM5477-R1]|uniref:hypothetical protein n=1 Tax=Paraburkholderia sp. MM5477-R1 TaxID=2991062 RepID=UPI003D1D4031
MAMVVTGIKDEEIETLLKEEYWPILAGALLVCGIDPRTNEGPLDEAQCQGLKIADPRIPPALRILALWRSQIGGGDLARPRDFLSWCKYRNIHEVDAFLERTRIAVPGFKPEWILRAQNMQRTAQAYGIGDRTWGVPTIDAEANTWFSDSKRIASLDRPSADRNVSEVSFPKVQTVEEAVPQGNSRPTRKSPPFFLERLMKMNDPPAPLTSDVVADAFGGRIGWSRTDLKKMLGDSKSYRWLHEARINPGAAPHSTVHWHPFVVAWALALGDGRVKNKKVLHDGTRTSERTIVKVSLETLDNVFACPGMAEWNDRWIASERAELASRVKYGE